MVRDWHTRSREYDVKLVVIGLTFILRRMLWFFCAAPSEKNTDNEGVRLPYHRCTGITACKVWLLNVNPDHEVSRHL